MQGCCDRAGRWPEITPSPFPHELEGLNRIKTVLPQHAPFRAWSNSEFRDGHGKWHEVDLLVLGRRELHVIELKYYSGMLRGTTTAGCVMATAGCVMATALRTPR